MSVGFHPEEDKNFEPLSQLTAQTIAGLVAGMSEQGDPLTEVFAGEAEEYDTDKLIICEDLNVQTYAYLDVVNLKPYRIFLSSTNLTMRDGKQPIETGVLIEDRRSGESILNMRLDFDYDGNYIPNSFFTEDEGFKLIRVLEDATLIDDIKQLFPEAA